MAHISSASENGLSSSQGDGEAVEPGRAGRKPGAKGKFTPKLGDQIRRDYGRSPAEELARRAFMDPTEYAREAGLKKGKGASKTLDVGRAYQKQERLLAALLPYTERKMPTEIEVGETKRVILQIGRVGVSAAEDAPTSRTIELVPANITKSQQNQQHSLERVEKSDNEKSDARR